MTLTVRGLVIRVVPYRDYDKLVSILTEEHGKIFFKANAVRSMVNPNSAACNLFSYSEFVLQKKQDRYYLTRAQAIRLPLGHTCDVATLSAASYLGELCDDVGRDAEGARSALHLLTNALVLLQKADRPVGLVKAVFELRLMASIGYLPELNACIGCGAMENITHFHPTEGGVLCRECAAGTDAMPVSESVLALMKRTVTVPESEAYALQLSEELLRLFGTMTERYLLSQLQRTFKTLDFYHQMKDLV